MLSKFFRSKSSLGGALIVSGTSIGGGMLALPVLTGLGGAVPAVIIYFISWIFMMATGLLLAESCLRKKRDVNLITLSEEALGKPGKYLCWLVYLVLFYSLFVSYLSVGATLLPGSLAALPSEIRMLIFLVVLCPFIYMGRWLM